MGNHRSGGFAYMPMVMCIYCGAKFRIGNHNTRRYCANKTKCQARQQRKKSKEAEGD